VAAVGLPQTSRGSLTGITSFEMTSLNGCPTDCNAIGNVGYCTSLNTTSSSSSWICVCEWPFGGDDCLQTPPFWPGYRVFGALYLLAVVYGIWRTITISLMPRSVAAGGAVVSQIQPTTSSPALTNGGMSCRLPWKYIPGKGSSGITQWMSLAFAIVLALLQAMVTLQLKHDSPINASSIAITEAIGDFAGCYSAALMARRLILPQAALHPPTRRWLQLFDRMMIVLVILAVVAIIASSILPPQWSIFKWTAAFHLLVVVFGIARSLSVLGNTS
jgi:hypothetical protein